MIVYGTSVSPFVRKVLAFIAEKGLRAEHKPVMFHDDSPEFQAASPTGKIPGFADGDYLLADSSAICQYLERKYPEPALYPHDPRELGRAIWFDEYADTVAFGCFGPVFFNLVVMPKVHGQEPDMALVDRNMTEQAPRICDYLENQINGPFLVGGRLTIADLAVASPFVNMKMAGKPIDADKWPKLAEYVSGILARPSFVGARDPKKAA